MNVVIGMQFAFSKATVEHQTFFSSIFFFWSLLCEWMQTGRVGEGSLVVTEAAE